MQPYMTDTFCTMRMMSINIIIIANILMNDMAICALHVCVCFGSDELNNIDLIRTEMFMKSSRIVFIFNEFVMVTKRCRSVTANLLPPYAGVTKVTNKGKISFLLPFPLSGISR